MKSLSLLLFPFVFLTFSLQSKSRLGEYYFGFGLSSAGGGVGAELEGDMLNLSVNSLASDDADFSLSYSYGKLESNSTQNTLWSIDLDYLFHFENLIESKGIFLPYIGGGIGYFNDDEGLRLSEDGTNWNLIAGTEILLTDSLSVGVGAKLFGLWSDFSENDISLDLSVTWWINHIHGVALEYDYTLDREVDYLRLQYLYSWR